MNEEDRNRKNGTYIFIFLGISFLSFIVWYNQDLLPFVVAGGFFLALGVSMGSGYGKN